MPFGAHDSAMSKTASRGYVAVALLVFAVAIAAFLGSYKLSSAALKPPTLTKEQNDICNKKKAAATKASANSDPLKQTFESKDVTEENRCVAAIYDTKTKTAKCVGERTTISIKKGSGAIESRPEANVPPGICATDYCHENSECSKVVPINGNGSLSGWTKAMVSAKYLTSETANQFLVKMGDLDANRSKELNDLINQTVEAELKLKETQQKLNDANSKLEGVLIYCEAINKDPTICTPENVNKAQVDAQNAREAQLAAQKERDELAAKQVQLQAPARPDDRPPVPSEKCLADPSKCSPAELPARQGMIDAATRAAAEERGPAGAGQNAGMNQLLQGLMRAMMQPQPQVAPAQACSTDPNGYAQQQQQYQSQLQQYNYQLQQYNYQFQLYTQQQQQLAAQQGDLGGGLGGLGAMGPIAPVPPIQPSPCTPATAGQCTAQQPVKPDPANCTVGTWQPTYSGACVIGWQCTAGGGPAASLTCQPKVADAGMTLAIAYSCASGEATGNGFTAADQPAGSATVTLATPPAGTNMAVYSLTCKDPKLGTSGAQCTVQVNKPSIILVANPKTVASGQTTLIGWTTAGMQSCIISSPNQANFTQNNSSNTSVTGAATTDPISGTANFTLNCQTTAGGTRSATVSVTSQ